MAKQKNAPNLPQGIEDLLYQALETELGGVQVYRTALQCVQNEDLRHEWIEYLGQTEEHAARLREICIGRGLDPDRDTPGRQVVRHIGKSLVKAMELALGSGTPAQAELVAAECVVHAETKDHMNWKLIGRLIEDGDLSDSDPLAEAYAQIEDQEDEHLYHTQGWARELWAQTLELDAQLPPPEEEEDVTSQEEAAQVEKRAKEEKRAAKGR